MKLTTTRTYIQFLQKDDFPELIDMFFEKDTFKYITPLQNKTREEYLDFLKSKLTVNQTYKTMGYWVVRDLKTKALIGTLNYYPMPEKSGFSFKHIGIHLKRDEWNKGYSKELLSELITYIKNELKEKEILAILDKKHLVSRKMLTNLGFKYYKELDMTTEIIDMLKLDCTTFKS